MLWLLCAAAAGAALHSNAYTSTPPAVRNGRFPIAAETATIRHAQELAVSVPIQRGIHLVSGEFQNAVTIVPYTVTAYWITPYFEDRPADPTWIETRVEDSNVILRWRPNIWSRISIHMRFTRSRPAPRQGFEPNAAAVSDVG